MALAHVNDAIAELLAEGVEGPADPKWSWFVTNEPNSGVLGVLDGLTAEQASTPPAPGRRTAAAHAGHVRFLLNAGVRWLRGENPQLDWEQSWLVSAVTAAEWETLKTDVRREFHTLRDLITQRQGWEPLDLKGSIATVAHVAYHLGALRQIATATHK